LSAERHKEFAERINYEFENLELLEVALTHKSWSAENKGSHPNEKLEFLGDSVLGLIVTEHIYKMYPDLSEGQLSLLRSVIVGHTCLAEVAEKLELGSYLRLGNASVSPALLEDAIEAVIGAIYLDGGWSAAQNFVLELLSTKITEYSTRNNEDYKSRLKIIFEQKFSTTPRYSITSDGPDHEKHFYASVKIEDEIVGQGEGRSKKEAEQSAAGKALKRFSDE
jgi:ribonuclease-3